MYQSVFFPSWDHFRNNINFQQELTLKWTSTVTRNTIFLQSKPYLQKFIARRSKTDHDGESVPVHLGWGQYMSFAVLGVSFWCNNFLNELIFKKRVPRRTQSLLVSKRGVVIVFIVVTFNTNEYQTIYGLIFTWAH